MSVLRAVRVLDLATADMGLTGQVLADLGADVATSAAPTGMDDYTAIAYGRNKRILRGAEQPLRRLLSGVDVLIESPARDGSWRFEVAELAREFPHLLHVSLSWFGRTGPKARYAGCDLIATAASGFLFLTGSPGAAPLRISAPQAALHAAADAAVAVLIALRERQASGLGQHIDAAAQDSLTLALLGRSLDAAVGQPGAERTAGQALIGRIRVRYVFAARDGFVLLQPGILPPLAAFGRRFAQWLVDEGLLAAEYAGWNWGEVAMGMLADRIEPAQWSAFEDAAARLFAARTKRELMDAAVLRKVLVGPLFGVGDLLTSPQIEARQFVGGGEQARHPGPFAAFSSLELSQSRAAEVVTPATLAAQWPPRRVQAPRATAAAPLAGLKVVDLFWVVAGPGATRTLADFGATVVHVESRNRLDMARAVPPYIDAVADPERAALFHTTNANKLGLTLDLSADAGRAVLTDLIAWADVLTESFSPGVIARLGFDYDRVRAINPRIIMVSSCLLGQTGPWKDYAGFGNLAAAVTGFHELTGRGGEAPTGCYGPYTDFIGVRYNALAILAALAHRDETGEGQYVDMAQAEAALHFLAPAAYEFWRTGVAPGARGNRDPTMAPHGVYPTAGEDCWVAIAVRDADDWRALCRCAGFDDWQHDRELADTGARRQCEDLIDERLARWTRTHAAADVASQLQDAGVPAHPVANTLALFDDPQLAHREHFHRIGHGDFGATTIESGRLLMSRSRARVPERALSYGRDNTHVLEQLLGYSPARRLQLETLGVLQ